MGVEKMSHSSNVVFKLTGNGLAWYVLPLPSVAFFACVVLSLIYDFESSTATHCHVRNYLPSISAAIGGHTPQRYIWKICIALHCAPRLVIAICYFNHYMSFSPIRKSRFYSVLAAVNSLLHALEVLCLVTLSYVSSTENFAIHEKSFIGFMVCSEVYMILSLILFKKSRSESPMSARDKKSYNWKFYLAVFNIGSFLLAVYVFFRHNRHCEPGMYTIYALLEYFVVASNIVFHGFFIADMGDAKLVFEHERKLEKNS